MAAFKAALGSIPGPYHETVRWSADNWIAVGAESTITVMVRAAPGKNVSCYLEGYYNDADNAQDTVLI